jgi:hypothetical protein
LDKQASTRNVPARVPLVVIEMGGCAYGCKLCGSEVVSRSWNRGESEGCARWSAWRKRSTLRSNSVGHFVVHHFLVRFCDPFSGCGLVVTSTIVALNVSVLCTKSVAAQAFPRLLLHQAKFCSAFFQETPVQARMNGASQRG